MGFIRISLKIEETLISWQTDVSNFRNINDPFDDFHDYEGVFI